MIDDLAVRLVGSMVEHVPIYFNTDKLLGLLISTPLTHVHYALYAPYQYEKITDDKYGCFYPKVLLRNDLIVYEPKKLRFFHKFSKVPEPFDYIADFQSKREILNIFRQSSSRKNSNLYSILGIIEFVTFIYDDPSQSETVVLKPQLIIPGYEYDYSIQAWENSQVSSYSIKNKALEF